MRPALPLLLLLLCAAPAPADDAVTLSAPVQPVDQPVVIIAPADEDLDRHAGYYYPAPDSQETYVGRARPLPEADRRVRVGFVVGLEQEIRKAGQPIPYALFAKGSEAEKLVMVALVDGPLDTLYRARGVLANLTAQSRLLPVFKEHGVEDLFTFFDLLVLLGYERLTLTDGKTWAHQVLLVPPP
jgi:hypothetical protein